MCSGFIRLIRNYVQCWCQTLFTSVYKTRICSKGGGIALKSMRRTQLSFPRAAPTRKTKHSLPAREELLPPSDPLSRLTAGGPPPNRPAHPLPRFFFPAFARKTSSAASTMPAQVGAREVRLERLKERFVSAEEGKGKSRLSSPVT
jgi:hypothetical protein